MSLSTVSLSLASPLLMRYEDLPIRRRLLSEALKKLMLRVNGALPRLSMEQMSVAPTDSGALRSPRSLAGAEAGSGAGSDARSGGGSAAVSGGAREWVEIASQALPEGEILRWATTPECGAVVVFSGTVRDHAEGRPGVTHLEYEAYAGPAERQMRDLASEVRGRWPMAGRIALIHRVGRLDVGESAVLVAVGTPHRPEAFAAASWAIDELKAKVAIWKKEFWDGGSAWVEGCQHSYAEPADTGVPARSNGRAGLNDLVGLDDGMGLDGRVGLDGRSAGEAGV